MTSVEDTPPPLFWLLLGDKLGDNAQAEIIAERLGWPIETRRLFFHEPYIYGKPRFKPSLYHVDPARSDRLEAPWPDYILTIGRRPSMAALWVQAESGGRTKLILIGRPKRWLDRFSLIIAPAQYRLPDRDNVLHLDLPLMRGNQAAIEAAGEAWQNRLADLPRPLTALLVGGQTKPFLFDGPVAEDLAERTVAQIDGGSLYVTTSRRTPAAVTDTLEQVMAGQARFFRWAPDAPDNPYLALLALADRFIVTGDSISMMIEVARLAKPLAIFDLPRQGGLVERWRGALERQLHSTAANSRGGSLQTIGNLLYRLGLARYSRDLTEIHRVLYRRGSAVPLGQPFPRPTASPTDEVDAVVDRIRALESG
jgi:hypothetical protein